MSTALADTGSLTLPPNETVTQRIDFSPYDGKHRETDGGVPVVVLRDRLAAERAARTAVV